MGGKYQSSGCISIPTSSGVTIISFLPQKLCQWHNVHICDPYGMNSSFSHTPILFVVPLHNFEELFMCWAPVQYMAQSQRTLCSGYLGSWGLAPTGVFTEFFMLETSHIYQLLHLNTPVICMLLLPSSIAQRWGHEPQDKTTYSWGSKVRILSHILDLSSFHHLPLDSEFSRQVPCTLYPECHVERNPLLSLWWDLGPSNSVITLHLTLCEPKQLNSQRVTSLLSSHGLSSWALR